MYPEISPPGIDVPISTYYLLNVAAWFAFLAVGLALTRSRPDLRRHWFWLFYGMVLCYSIGASLLFRLTESGIDSFSLRQPRDQAHCGGFWGGPLLFLGWTAAYFLANRIRADPFLDAFAIAWSVAHVLAKLACFAAGCCFGRPTDGAFAVVLPAHEIPIPRHPTQLYEAALHGLTAVLLCTLHARGWLKGRLVLLLGVIYCTWQPSVDAAEAGHRPTLLGGPFSASQMICLMALVFSLTALLLDHAHRRVAVSRRAPCPQGIASIIERSPGHRS